MRISRFISIAAAALVAGGCFQSTTLIRINSDGSGTIEQTTLVTAAALRQLRQFAAGGESGKPVDLFSTNQAREMATALGPDVTVVSTTRIKTAEGEGSKAILSFTDINKLQVKNPHESSDGFGLDTPGIGTAAAEVRFSLTRAADGHALLRIAIPTAHLPRTAP